ncbi:retrovirus-related pol polyprotein from transposon TNT 1-94 [Tanacetum coccineum]
MEDMIREKLALKEQVDSLEQNLSKQIKEKKYLLQTFTVFKNESKEKEDKYMENKIDLEKKIKKLDNILFKVGQSAQTVHMLTKPQAFYDNIYNQALGYQNPFHLMKAQRIKATLYDGIVMSDKHVAKPVIDESGTLILEKKRKEIIDIAAQTPSTHTIVPGMFKLDLEHLVPRLLQNRDVHIKYIKYAQEQGDILRGIVKQAKAKQPLDKELDFACCPDCSLVSGLQMFETHGRESLLAHELSRKCDYPQGSRDTNLYTISLDDMLKTSLIYLLSKASKTKSWLWHCRLSYLNFGTLNKLLSGLARGIPTLKFQKDHICLARALGKSNKSSHQPKAKDTNQEKLYLLHMDLFLRTKDEAPEAIIKCIKNIQVRLNATVHNVRTDNGTKFVNQTLREFYENVGISHQTSVARTPQQNSVVKRQKRPLVEAAHTMLIFSKALLFLWPEAINTTCYTQNRSIIRRRYNKYPYDLMQYKKPNLSFFHVFGALCYPTNDNDDLESNLLLETDISQKVEKPSKKRQNRTRDGKVCENEAKSKSSQLREEKAKKNIT